MFLIAATKFKIKGNFNSNIINEYHHGKYIMTIVTDKSLSNFSLDSKGFSVIESLPIKSKSTNKSCFSIVRFDKDISSFNINQNSISGRPIYYHVNKKGEFFCSTHISLLRKVGVLIKENKKMLPEYFCYRCVMPPMTLYHEIYRVFNGSEINVNLINLKWKVQKSIKFNMLKSLPESLNGSSNNIFYKSYKLIEESIMNIEYLKDEVAVLMSGGIDSSITSSIAKSKLGINDSYSTGYPFEKPNLNYEKKYALTAGKALGFDHKYYQATTKQYLRGFLESILLAEQPLHHLQSICLHLLFKNGIPKNKKIIIQGLGAGGFFGNFRNFLYLQNRMIFRVLSKKPIMTILKLISNITGKRKGSVSNLEKINLNYQLSNRKNPIWSSHAYGDEEWICKYFGVNKEYIIKNQYNSLKTFENYSIYDQWGIYALIADEDVTLAIFNKIADGNNKILFSPFYDQKLLNYVFSIPWHIKLMWPENSLRKKIAYFSKVPKFIISRKKLGFGVARNDWAIKGGVFEPLVGLASKVFDEKEIRKMQSLEPKKAMTFWNILNYAIWKRLCINNESLEELLKELDEEILKQKS